MDGYEYVIALVDQISGPAKDASAQIKELTGAMLKDADAVQKLQTVMGALKATGTLTKESQVALQGGIDKATASMMKSGNQARGLAEKERELAKQARETADAEHAASQQADSLGGTLESLAPMAGMAAAALAAFAAVLAAAFIGGAKLAIDAAHFKAQTLAALQSVTGTSLAAQDTFINIRRISDEIGISEAKAQKLGLSLLDAGVAQKDLGDTIKSIAMLEKVRGEEAAGKLQELIKKSAAAGTFKMEGESLVGTGLAQADVISELAKKLGTSNAAVEAQLKAGKITAADGIAAINGALNAKMGGGGKGLSSFGDVLEKAFEIFKRLFEDVNVAPLLEAVAEMGSWFDKSTVLGNTLHEIIGGTFDTFFQMAKDALPYAKTALLEIIITALKIYIAMKPLIKSFDDLGTAIFGAGNTGTAIFDTFMYALGNWSVVFDIVVFAVKGFVDALTMVVNAFQVLYAVGSTVLTAIEGAFDSVYGGLAGVFSSENAIALATTLIDGLVGGLSGGAGRVIQAMVGVGQGAIDGVKGVLGIRSPSAVMAGLADNAVNSFADTAEDGTAKTQGALEAVVAPPAAAGGGGGGGGASITIEAGAIVITGAGESAPALAELLEARLAEMLESVLMQMGAAA